jgi:hypothetical protein
MSRVEGKYALSCMVLVAGSVVCSLSWWATPIAGAGGDRREL